MKLLITGANGQLGCELQRQLREGACALGPIPERLKNATVLAVDLPVLDIADRAEVVAFVRRQQPDVILNCAAYTNVDGCEVHREDAFRANAIGPANLAQAAEKVGARLVHISTDYVFSGQENGGISLDEAARPAPQSAYGETKLLGEEYVRQFCRRYFVVRTAWLYGRTGKNFVRTMATLGAKPGHLEVVDDQRGNPTNAEDLAWHLLQLAVSHNYGVYHCTGTGICSWYEFTREILRLTGGVADLAPCTSAEYAQKHPGSARRPAWSALENRMLACTIGDHMRPWQEALADFFATSGFEN